MDIWHKSIFNLYLRDVMCPVVAAGILLEESSNGGESGCLIMIGLLNMNIYQLERRKKIVILTLLFFAALC